MLVAVVVASQDSSKTFRLAGRVLDCEGRPAEDVQVRIEPEFRALTTSVDGTFAFDDLAARTYSVSARKDRFYAWPTLVNPAESRQPVTLQLQLGATVIIHAFADRARVVGAKLMLEHGIRATSDNAGRIEVQGLAPGQYRGVLLADGWADEHFMLSLHDDPGGISERTLTLAPGARIEGVVLDGNGDPVEDATVLGWREGENRPPCQAWTAADGTWNFSARSGAYRLWAQSRDHGRSSELSFTTDGHSTQRDLVLQFGPAGSESVLATVVDAAKRLICANKPTTVAGIVVDEDGAPAPGADVRVLLRSFVRADSNGRFEVEGLEPGEYEIVADWGGPWFGPRKNAARQAVHAGDIDVRLVLPTGATVNGRAMLDGKPLTYFGLRLVGEPESPSGGMPIGVRDDEGRFELRHVHPGTWRIAIIAPGTQLVTSSEFTVTKNEAVDLGDIVVALGHRLSGHVRDHTGAPVAGARVCIGRMFSSSAHRSQLDQLFLGVYETRTDDAGAYAFEGIDAYRDPGRVTELIWAAHVAAGASVIHEVPKTDSTMDFVLLGAGRIEGSVQNLRGGRGHLLAVRPDEPPWARHAHCDKEGRFAFEDLPPGDYVVKLDVPEIEQVEPATVTVIADRTVTATLVMNSTSVKLRVKVPVGRGKDLVIEPTSEGAGVGGRIRGIMGMGSEDTCSLEYVRPGSYRLSLDGKLWTSITVEASPEEQTIDLRALA